MSEEYQTVFPGVQLAEDSKAAGKWNTRQGGSYYAVGVGSNILGRGANKVMIDDPFGSMEDAKADRARPFAAQVNRGNVTMINGDWNAAYREELRGFPNGKFKDQADASSRAFAALVERHRKPMVFSRELLDAIGPPEPPRPPW